MNSQDMFIEVSNLVFNDENLCKYFTILFYHYEYDFTNEDCFLEDADKLSRINSLLSNAPLDEQITMALSNRYIACLFYLSYHSTFGHEETEETKEIIGLLNNSLMMKKFMDMSSDPFSDKIKTKNNKKWKEAQESLIKNSNERLKAINLSMGRLEDENEQLKQRIESAKKVWEENKIIKEENERLKALLRKLGVESSLIRSDTDQDLSVRGTSSDKSATVQKVDSRNPMLTELSTPSENNMDSTRSYAHTFRERGRFGSHPSHDDFGDESAP